jgi:hypothetical protein
MQFGIRTATFRRSPLLPSSGLNKHLPGSNNTRTASCHYCHDSKSVSYP